jgi:hypothetical protein
MIQSLEIPSGVFCGPPSYSHVPCQDLHPCHPFQTLPCLARLQSIRGKPTHHPLCVYPCTILYDIGPRLSHTLEISQSLWRAFRSFLRFSQPSFGAQARSLASSIRCLVEEEGSNTKSRRMLGVMLVGTRRSMRVVSSSSTLLDSTFSFQSPYLFTLLSWHARFLHLKATERWIFTANIFSQHNALTTSAPAPSHASTSRITAPAHGRMSKTKSNSATVLPSVEAKEDGTLASLVRRLIWPGRACYEWGIR